MSSSSSNEPSPIYTSQFDFDIMYDPYSAEHSNDIDFLKYQNQINSNNYTADSSPLMSSADDDENSAAAATVEQSFIYESTSCGAILPIKYSQDMDAQDGSIFDEVKQITTSGYYYGNNTSTTTTTTSSEQQQQLATFNNYKFNDLSQLSDNNLKFKIYQDDDDSTCLETVERFSDVMINGQLIQPSEINPHQRQLQFVSSVPSANNNGGGGAFNCLSNNFNIIKKEHIEEHNYTAKVKQILLENKSENLTNNNSRMRVLKSVSCKRKLVMVDDDMMDVNNDDGEQQKNCAELSTNLINNRTTNNREMKRVPPLKIKIPIVLRDELSTPAAAIVNTPDIANDILAMEDDIFDLIKFIDCPTKVSDFVPFYFYTYILCLFFSVRKFFNIHNLLRVNGFS